jgi:hypothetical protein
MPTVSSQRQAVRNIVRALQGQSTPTSCVYLLIGWIALVVDHGQPIAGPDTAKLANRMNNAMVEWITRFQSREDLERAFNMECRCTILECSEQTHLRGESNYNKNARSPTGDDHPKLHLMALLFQPFESVIVTNDSYPPPVLRFSHRKQWPLSIVAMLPHGPENTIRGVVQWFKLSLRSVQRVYIYMALNAISAFCYPLVMPYVATCRPFLDLGITQAIRDDLILLDTPSSSPISITDYIVVWKNLRNLLNLLQLLLLNIAGEAERRIFHRMAPLQVLQSYEDMLQICESLERYLQLPGFRQNPRMSFFTADGVESSMQSLNQYGGRLLVDCPHLMSVSTSKHHTRFIHAQQQDNGDSLKPQAVWETFSQIIAALEYAQRCAHPQCTNTVFSVPLKRCMGCSITLYCSRRCQKRAWTFQIGPHRTVCGIIRSACHRYDVQPQTKRTPNARLPSSFDVNEAMSIITHYNTIKQVQIETLSTLDVMGMCS